MHKAKHQLHIRYANRLHVFNNNVSAIDPLLTKRVLTIMYKSTKTRQRQFQKYGSNTVKFRIAKKYFHNKWKSYNTEPLRVWEIPEFWSACEVRPFVPDKWQSDNASYNSKLIVHGRHVLASGAGIIIPCSLHKM